jgi:hypothetical protein
MQKFLSLLENNFKYLVAALIIFIPLYPKFPFISIPGIYVSVRFEDFLLLLLAIVTFIKIIPRAKDLFKDKIIGAFMAFFLVGATSLVSGIFLTGTVNEGIGFLHLARRFEYIIPFLAVFAFFPQEKGKNLEFYVKTLTLTVFILFLYGVGQRYFNFPVIITQNEEYSKGIALRWITGSHINSTFAGHYDLATFLVLVLPVFISLIFIYKDRISRSIFLGVSLCGLWLLISSVSRISFVSYLLATSVSLFLLKKYKAIVIVVGASLVLSAFSPPLFARYRSIIDVALRQLSLNFVSYAQDEYVSPSPAPQVFEDRSTSIRLNVEWPRALRALSKNPILGTGYSSIGLATDNDYLRALGEGGVLVFLAFVLILFRISQVFSKAISVMGKFTDIELGVVVGVIGGFVGILVNAFFIDIFEASKFATMFWLLIAIAVYLIKDKINEQEI